MSSLKGYFELEQSIQQAILQELQMSVNVELYDEFLWTNEENTLSFCPWTDENTDKLWQEWIEKTFNVQFHDFSDIFYFSFLHELGHKMTLKFVSKKEYKKGMKLQQKEELIPYWSCYREYIATKWAVDFCLNHWQQFENFSKIVFEALQQFYKINSVIND